MDNEILNILKAIQDSQNKTNERLDKIEINIKNLEADVKDLKKGQEEIKTLITELEPKNAANHLELKEMISEVKKDLTKLEVVTKENTYDVAYLKAAR